MPEIPDIQMGTNKLVRRNIPIRGTDGTVSFPIWDFVDKCEESCPVAKTCPYKMVGNCKVMYQYMRTVMELVQNEFQETTAEQLFHIGMHLVPLYRHLCRMKLVEASVKAVSYYTNQGGIKIHPIFREIREQIKLIDETWVKLNLKKVTKGDVANKDSYEWMTGDGEPVVIGQGEPLSEHELAGAEGMAKPDEETLPDMQNTVLAGFDDVDESPIAQEAMKKMPKKKKKVVPLKWKK